MFGALETYGTLALTETSPQQAFVEPFTLEEMKAFLNIPDRTPTDPNEDDHINSLIAAARVQAEYYQNRDLVIKQWDLVFDYFTDYYLSLRRPLISVDLIQYRDSGGATTTMVEDTDYIVDLAKGVVAPPVNNLWPTFTPWPTSSLLVRFRSGYASASNFWVSDGLPIKVGMRRLIADWFFNRLPFEQNMDPGRELPFGVTQMLSQCSNKYVG